MSQDEQAGDFIAVEREWLVSHLQNLIKQAGQAVLVATKTLEGERFFDYTWEGVRDGQLEIGGVAARVLAHIETCDVVDSSGLPAVANRLGEE